MYRYYFLSGLCALSVVYDSRSSLSFSQLLSFLSLAAILFVFSYQLGGKK